MINQNKNNYLKSVEGFGSKRLFGVYLGINHNLSRIYNLTVIFYKFNVNWYNIILATITTSSALVS